MKNEYKGNMYKDDERFTICAADLSPCPADLSICGINGGVCGANVGTCAVNLSTCGANVGGDCFVNVSAD